MLLNSVCFIYISSSLNNTFVCLTNVKKKILYKISIGKLRKKGIKKTISARFDGAELGKLVATQIKLLKFAYIFIFYKGVGRGKRSVLFGLRKILKKKFGIKIKAIFKQNFLPQNGCRLIKKQRK